VETTPRYSIPDDPNPGIIGAVYHDGVWISLTRYIPPKPNRAAGSGCFCYFRGTWLGQVTDIENGIRKIHRARSPRFCDMLRKFSALPKPERFEEACRRKPRTYRRDLAMQCARELGTHTESEWVDLQERQQHRCRYCGELRKLTKDHLTPVSRGGSDAIDNITGACLACNTQKNNRTLNEYLRYRRQWVAMKRDEARKKARQ
jgi:5-methylcytosine-specific restriction endonuclease McrA